MHFKKLFCYSALLLVTTGTGMGLYAQKIRPDSAYIRSFQKRESLELYPGIYHTTLNFTNVKNGKSGFKFITNSGGYTGIYASYKWLSFKYSFVIPGSKINNDAKLKYLSLGYKFKTRRFSFRPFYDAYDGLLIPAATRRGTAEVFREIQLKDAGFNFMYFTNVRKMSYRAATGFSEQQLKSAGSVLFAITPVWQRLRWSNPSRALVTDSATYDLLQSDPEWYSVIPKAGYIYNFTWHDGRWSIAPQVLLGAGGIKETHPRQKQLQLVTSIQGMLTAGYNGPAFYVYVSAFWDKQGTNLFIKKLEETNTDFSLTMGYRFKQLKQKILRIL